MEEEIMAPAHLAVGPNFHWTGYGIPAARPLDPPLYTKHCFSVVEPGQAARPAGRGG